MEAKNTPENIHEKRNKELIRLARVDLNASYAYLLSVLNLNCPLPKEPPIDKGKPEKGKTCLQCWVDGYVCDDCPTREDALEADGRSKQRVRKKGKEEWTYRTMESTGWTFYRNGVPQFGIAVLHEHFNAQEICDRLNSSPPEPENEDANKLEELARLFDLTDKATGEKRHEVQDDLRRIAQYIRQTKPIAEPNGENQGELRQEIADECDNFVNYTGEFFNEGDMKDYLAENFTISRRGE